MKIQHYWLGIFVAIGCGGEHSSAVGILVDHLGQEQRLEWCRAIYSENNNRLELEIELASSQSNSYFRFWIPTISVIGDLNIGLGNIDRYELAWDGGQPVQPRTGDQPPDGSGAILFSNDTGLDYSPFQLKLQAAILNNEFLFGGGTCNGTLRVFASP